MLYPLETYVRVGVTLAGLLGALFAPWWVPLICMLLLSLRFSAWEVPFIGLLVDFLWLPGDKTFAIPIFMLAGIVLVWVASPLRKQFLL